MNYVNSRCKNYTNPVLSHVENTDIFFRSTGTKTVAESKCPELLANFCDMLLRKSPYSKKRTSEEIEEKLKDVVSLLSSS